MIPDEDAGYAAVWELNRLALWEMNMTREEQRQDNIDAQVHRIANNVATVAWSISDVFDAIGHRSLDAAIEYSAKRLGD